MKTSPVIRGLRRWLKKTRYEWLDRSHGTPMITRVMAISGGAVIIVMINYDQVWHYVLSLVLAVFVLTQISGWVKNWRYLRQCKESEKEHNEEQWALRK